MILALLENGNRTDAEVAELCGMKKGTVASIRRRLVETNAVSFKVVPHLAKIGCEMIGFHRGATNPGLAPHLSSYMDFTASSPQIFFGAFGANNVVLYTALRDISDYETFKQGHVKFFSGERHNSKAKLSDVIFPCSLTRANWTPQHTHMVYNFFDLDIDPPKIRYPEAAEVETPDFSSSEREVMISVVENPTFSDRAIASIAKISRQAVTKIRNRLFDDGVLSMACLPHFHNWGFEIYFVAHPKFKMWLSWDARIKEEPVEVTSLSFFSLSKADEAIGNYVAPYFKFYTDRSAELADWFHSRGLFDENMETLLFPLERSEYLRNFTYGPAIRSLLPE